tara:strand:- start:832 stop:1713 length:882 start_codon:yes stop_codon:yes gene_type:complete
MSDVYFISEVSSNHSSSIQRCKEFIRTSKEIGCSAVKFQLFKLDELFSIEARRANPEFEHRRKWELPVSFLPELKRSCVENEIDFSCTPFYIDAVAELEPYVDFYKVASYELLWLDLLAEVAKTGKKVIISSGMANLEEIDNAINHLRKNGCNEIELLHCVSEYPATLASCNLSAIKTLRDRYKLKIGWSDHSMNPVVIDRAISKWDASIIEFHIDLDGDGEEYQSGHCWLPHEIEDLISSKEIKLNNNSMLIREIDGDGIKKPAQCELFERSWRADPSDGLRPLLETRKKLA